MAEMDRPKIQYAKTVDGLNIAYAVARVMAAAWPDEVLVSSTVKDLVAGSGLTFEDRGARQLKGVPDEWRLFAVQPKDA